MKLQYFILSFHCSLIVVTMELSYIYNETVLVHSGIIITVVSCVYVRCDSIAITSKLQLQ